MHERFQATLAQSLKQFGSLEKQNLNYTLFPKYPTHRAAREKPPKDWPSGVLISHGNGAHV